MTEVIRTTCTRDCPDSCGILATVEDGKITRHKGNPDHPITSGFLCANGNDYLKRFYSTDRLLYPQRRTANGWERISWDDALDLAAEKLCSYRDAFGPKSVVVVNYSGLKGWVSKVLNRLFWAHFGGATFTVGGLSVEAAAAAQDLDFGGDDTHDPNDHANSDAFVIWGKNVAVTRQHSIPFVNQARKWGAAMVVIDPVRSAVAQKADKHYQIRPGTDGLLAIGIARLLIERGAVDDVFVREHTSGFEAYREMVLSYDLEVISQTTDLTPEQIGEIADLYATRKPLATLIGLGPSYWMSSGAMVRLIDALAAISGNVGVPGGGANTDMDTSRGLDLSALKDAPRADTRRVLLPRLGDEILGSADPPIKMGWIAGANPAASAPDTGRVKEGLRSLEFLVVVEQFMSATAELADLVLPCTTYLEMEDLVSSYGHHWIGLANQVVPPLGEAKPDGQIVQLLAQRLGFGDALAGDPTEWIGQMLEPAARKGVTLETLRDGPRRNPDAPLVPFADRRFGTPSGKFEFITKYAPAYARPEDGSLHLVATKTLKMINSQILPEDLPEKPAVRVHPDVLVRTGIASGEEAWVVSKAGRVRARVLADEAVRRDVLLFNPALWEGDLSGVNQLRESLLTDIGNGAAMHQTMVALRPI